MLNCREVTRLVSDSMERKLGLVDRMELRIHTMMCDGCKNFKANMHFIRKMSAAFVRGAADRVPDDDGKEPNHPNTPR